MSEAAYDVSKERLCFECFRAQRDRRRAQLLAEVPPASSRLAEVPVGRFPETGSRELTTREIQHRFRMLAYLRSARKA
jgi:hypothetical protein